MWFRTLSHRGLFCRLLESKPSSGDDSSAGRRSMYSLNGDAGAELCICLASSLAGECFLECVSVGGR